MMLRICAVILLLLSVLFWPFWLSVILAIAGLIYFKIFFEAPVLFLLSDLLYGTAVPEFSGMVFVSFFIFIILLLIAETVKKNSNFSIHNR
ncbi:MAG TPA: hypothetical protein VJH06_01725 [Candidatus Paceibacterota bacterium]